mmetsp:Transcript_52438/g.112132  ORF Transcript_52438/g.112132 Transcript_52438/m.112132 type:complete len:622 (-) Transcript_52438:198-2063(-)
MRGDFPDPSGISQPVPIQPPAITRMLNANFVSDGICDSCGTDGRRQGQEVMVPPQSESMREVLGRLEALSRQLHEVAAGQARVEGVVLKVSADVQNLKAAEAPLAPQPPKGGAADTLETQGGEPRIPMTSRDKWLGEGSGITSEKHMVQDLAFAKGWCRKQVLSPSTELQAVKSEPAEDGAEDVASGEAGGLGAETSTSEYEVLRAQTLQSKDPPPPALSKCRGSLRKFMRSQAFESVALVLIVANGVLQGYAVEHLASKGYVSDSVDIARQVFAYTFLAEIFLRMVAEGYLFFWGEGMWWNLLDSVVVVASIVEFVIKGIDEAAAPNRSLNYLYLRLARAMRMVSILRAVRFFRFFRELRLMVHSLLSSLKTMIWGGLLLGVSLYICALCLVEAATVYRLENSDGDDLTKNFGSLGEAVYYLFQGVSSGMLWGDLAKPFVAVNWGYAIGFSCIMCILSLMVLNIITAVLVQEAHEKAESEKEDILKEEAVRSRELQVVLDDVCSSVQGVVSGSVASSRIGLSEFQALLADERARAYFSGIGLHPTEAWGLFRLLDLDSSGAIDRNEFAAGCVRLKGRMRSVDLPTLMYENKRVMSKFYNAMKSFQDQLDQIHTVLQSTWI